MIISTSSNVVSIVYIILVDVLLPIFLAYLVRIFLSSRNVKAIYRNGKSTRLSSSASVSLVHQEVSEKQVGIAVAILSTLIIASAVAGGFSIVGISREPTVKMKAPVVIEAGSGEDVIDFTKHVSEDGGTVSKTFLLANNAILCRSLSGRLLTVFASMSEDQEGLNELKFPRNTQPPNFACLVKEEQFVEKRNFSYSYSDSRELRACRFTSRAGPGKLVKGVLATNEDCPLEVSDFWCARYEIEVCAGAARSEFGYTVVVVHFEEDPAQPFFLRPVYRTSAMLSRDKISSTSIRSLAYLWSTRTFISGRADAFLIVHFSIRTDADIERIKDQGEVTEIHLVFLALTLGTALVLLALASLATCYTWRTNVSKLGLQACNRFYSAHDMLMCAIQEASQEVSRGSKEGTRSEEGVVFGVSRKMPHVGPLWESDDEGSEFYAEKELEGRCHTSMTESEQG